MTPRGGPLTENQKAYALAAMVPLLWPLLMAMILCDIGSAIANTSRKVWHRIKLRMK